jgi:hypothetical protein
LPGRSLATAVIQEVETLKVFPAIQGLGKEIHPSNR